MGDSIRQLAWAFPEKSMSQGGERWGEWRVRSREGRSGLADAEGTEQPNAFSEPSFRLGSEKSGRLSGLQL